MARLRTFCHSHDEEAAALLFDIESYLRVIVRWEAAAIYGDKWLGCIPNELIAEIKDRLQQERDIGYLDSRPDAPLSYLTLSELKDIILGPLWTSTFKIWGAKELIGGDFKKLIAVRNKVAHFRPVTIRDLRNAERFAEDLVEWTSHYRRIREASQVIDGTARRDAQLAKMETVLVWWDAQEASGRLVRCKASLTRVHRFLSIEVGVDLGSMRAKTFIEMLNKHNNKIAFIRLGDWGEKLCCYVAKVLPEDQMIAIFEDCLSLMDDPTEKIAQEQIRTDFDVTRRDYILPWRLEMPLDFRI